jgi:hypothetical protein
LKELVDAKRVQTVLLVIAIAGPIAGAGVGLLFGLASRRVGRRTVWGFVIGLAGPAIFGLHALHGALIRHFGLDSVAGLLIALGVFAVLGFLCGVVLRSLSRRLAAQR